MKTVEIICIVIFIILFLIQTYCNIKLSWLDDEYEKLVDKLNDDKLKMSFIKNYANNKKLNGIFAIIALIMGFIIGIGLTNSDFQKMGVREYLRGNVEVKQKTVYEDSVLIKCDTIINLK